MKYLFYIPIWLLIHLLYFIWELKFESYSLNDYIFDIENYEYPIDYP